MKKLPENFSLERYGLKVRLVSENDADFILSLRSDPSKTKYMITLDNEIESQKKWIQEYKKREKEGLDYYLIYSNIEDKPIGLNRISHLDYKERTAKASSWIAIEGLINETFKMSIIQSEIAFNLIGIESTWSDIHKNNKRLIRFYKLFDYQLKDIGTDYYHLHIMKSDFLKTYDNRITKLFLKDL